MLLIGIHVSNYISNRTKLQRNHLGELGAARRYCDFALPGKAPRVSGRPSPGMGGGGGGGFGEGAEAD